MARSSESVMEGVGSIAALLSHPSSSEILHLPTGSLIYDLCGPMHPILAPSQFPTVKRRTYRSMIQALLLVSSILDTNHPLHHFFARAFHAPILRVRTKRLLGRYPNTTVSRARGKEILRRLAGYVRFETAELGLKYGATINDNTPASTKQVSWLGHRQGVGVVVKLKKALVDAIGERKSTLKGASEARMRVLLVLAFTILHELAHCAEMLRFDSFSVMEDGFSMIEGPRSYWQRAALTSSVRGMNEWGFELERVVVGWMVTMHNGDKIAKWGLLARGLDYLTEEEELRTVRKRLLSMRWVAWWFRQRNIEALAERGPSAVPEPLAAWMEWDRSGKWVLKGGATLDR
jgi:hypothetical protein